MSFGVLAGIALVVGLILAVVLLSGRRVKDSSDFLSGSGKAGTFLVAGAIMGSLVGSQATMGTAQLSFQFGFSGWWFTLGCCFGCLALGILYSHKLRNQRVFPSHSLRRTYLHAVSRYAPMGRGDDFCSSHGAVRDLRRRLGRGHGRHRQASATVWRFSFGLMLHPILE